MEWLEWSDEAFETARERGVPVFLFLTAAWCRWCRELEQQVLADPGVERAITTSFVAIRVDKDRRPDIDARYSKGGWPTLAYLDDAGLLIASDSYLEVDELLPRLDLVSGYYAENREAIRRRLAEADAGVETRPAAKESELTMEPVEWTASALLATADAVHGGWGARHKFPHPEAIDFALVRWSQTGVEDMRKLVLRTLRGMQRGEIQDRVEGGFYRYATAPDWSGPHHEKMLDSNAQRLYAYLEAYQAFGEQTFRETAEGCLAWMQGSLLDPATGAYRGSQDADPVYARLTSLAARREHGAPAIDPTLFANWNAMAVSALLKAAVVLGDDRWRVQAVRTLEFLFEEMYDERNGVYHYWDGTYHLAGMLSDQAYCLRALIDAHQYTGDGRWLDLAVTLADLTIENLKSEGGGFWDTRYDPGAVGGLRRRNRSILENAVMAEALLRLAHLTRSNDYSETATETLASFLQDYRRYGHFVAGYARAVDLLFHPPVHVTIVGSTEAPDTQALRDAALSSYCASRIVQVIDPERDAELLARCGLASVGPGRLREGARAYVHRGRESYAETSDPRRLPALMTRIERAR
jgi:uncharacterized protein YyaL (SSP411 family)